MTATSAALARLVDTLVAQIEAGAGEWTMPWHALTAQRNALTDRRYQGTNVLALALAGYDSPYWATYRQWQSVDAQVRHGETATGVFFWKQIRADDDDSGDGRPRRIARLFSVFNAAQVDGWTPPPPPETLNPADRDAAVDAVIAATGARIDHVAQDRAYYQPALDRIVLPPYDTFATVEGFYGTVLHELVHWTGHPERCARDLTGRFGDDAYAMEELIAEVGAAFLSVELAVTPAARPDHAAYLASWCRTLRADPKVLWTVAAAAEKAAGFITAPAPVSV